MNTRVAVVSILLETGSSVDGVNALLHEFAPFCRVVVGGAVLNADYAERIGADKYAKDAVETVRYAESLADR